MNPGNLREACCRGHRMTTENVYTEPRTGRMRCRECMRMQWKGRLTARKRGTVTPYIGVNGYRYVGQKLEHRLVVERAIGRKLRRSEYVHHVDGNKLNNDPSNLVACQDGSYHMLLHRRQAALEACGDPGALFCQTCDGYSKPGEMLVRFVGPRKTELIAVHKSCRKVRHRDWREYHVSEAA